MTAPDARLLELLERHPEPARPRIVGIAATHPRALVRPRYCACMSPDCCIGAVDGRNAAGSHCKRHLVDTLEIA